MNSFYGNFFFPEEQKLEPQYMENILVSHS